MATPDNTSTMFTQREEVQIPSGSPVAAMLGSHTLVSNADQAQVIGGRDPNAVAGRDRTTGANGNTYVVTTSGARVCFV